LEEREVQAGADNDSVGVAIAHGVGRTWEISLPPNGSSKIIGPTCIVLAYTVLVVWLHKPSWLTLYPHPLGKKTPCRLLRHRPSSHRKVICIVSNPICKAPQKVALT